LFTVLVLICSTALTPDMADCNRNNAVHVVQVPEQVAVPASCMMRGQAYLAGTSIGREIAENETVKVLCIRSSTPSANVG
jgi:hypothetical protein